MCMVGPDVLFLGSWVGDSLLIQAMPEDQVGVAPPLCWCRLNKAQFIP